MKKALNKFFKIEERGSNIKTELLAGLTIFLAMVYILPVNSGMLSNTGMPIGGIFLATALAAVIATLVMALYANYPIALAPGMGINAYFTFIVAMSKGWQFGLAATFISGVIFLLISVTGLRVLIINAIPMGLKYAVGAGIGFLIAFIGLQNSGIVVGDANTLVKLGNLADPSVLLTLFGLILVVLLYVKGNKFSLILGMVITAVVGIIFGLIFTNTSLPTLPTGSDFSNTFNELKSIKEIFGQAFKWEFVKDVLTSRIGWISIFTFLFMDFFDTAGTLSAVGISAGLIDTKTGELKDADRALLADSLGTVVGAVLGASTTTAFIESETGIEQGGRTGLTAAVVAVLFGLSIFIYPVFAIFTGAVTAIALIMVGAMMVTQLKAIDWSDNAISISAFMTILFMTMTYSIAEGIAFGFVMYTIIMVSGKKRKEVSPVMYGLAIFFVLNFIFSTLAAQGII